MDRVAHRKIELVALQSQMTDRLALSLITC
jgi:hypothetical protein